MDTSSREIIRIPTNMDIALTTSIKRLLYDNLEFKDMNGKVKIREGIAQLDDLEFNLLEGDFTMSGFYNSNNQLPLFNFNFKIDSLSAKEVFFSFNTIQAMAPVARDLAGVFSTDVVICGAFDSVMMPIMESVSAYGHIDLRSVTYDNPKFMTGLNKITGDQEETFKRFISFGLYLFYASIAAIIFLDTFKNNLSSIFPNLELFLFKLNS